MWVRRHINTSLRCQTICRRVKLQPAKVTYLLWDTAGQEEYDAITRAYYKA